MSTVGYGDLSPTGPGSRVFTVVYTFVGIIVVFTQLSALMITLVEPGVEWLRAQTSKVLPQQVMSYPGLIALAPPPPQTSTLPGLTPPQGFDIDGSGNADYLVPTNAAFFYVTKLFLPFVAVMLLQLAFGAIFMVVEGWDFGTALYLIQIPKTMKIHLADKSVVG